MWYLLSIFVILLENIAKNSTRHNTPNIDKNIIENGELEISKNCEKADIEFVVIGLFIEFLFCILIYLKIL